MTIYLFGEPEFPVVEDSNHDPIDHRELGLSQRSNVLVDKWIDLVRTSSPEQHDLAVMAGLRAATAIARDLNFSRRVNLAMCDPLDGPWFSIDVIEPK
jgi:hypothetical protein